MPATLAELVKVKSQLVEDLELFYQTLIDKLDTTPWFRVGVPIRASTIAIPVRVAQERHAPQD